VLFRHLYTIVTIFKAVVARTIEYTAIEMCRIASLVKTLGRVGLYRMSSPELYQNVRVSSAGNGKEHQRPLRVTLIEGHGTGPVVCAAVRKIFKAALVPVEWDYQTLGIYRDHKTDRMTVNPQVLSSAHETGLVLCAKDSAVGQNDSAWSDSLALNKALNAFVGVRKFNSVVGHEPYGPVNLINIRDNVSGEYSEIEHLVSPGNNHDHRLYTLRSLLYKILERAKYNFFENNL